MKRRIILITIIGLFLLMVPLMAEAGIVDSGTCGENLTWTLDDEGLLLISGTGSMNNHPWQTNSIKKVIIEEGVTNICYQAFYNCINLTEVTISEGVNTIEGFSFYGCERLKSISFPESITSIHNYAFSNCGSPINIDIKSLESWINIDIGVIDSVPNMGGRECYLFLNNSEMNNINIPSSIQTIRDYSFSCFVNIKTVIIPNSVSSIGSFAFEDCHNLVDISIPESIISVGDRSFANCSKLSKITFSSNLTSIGKDAFSCCRMLASLILPPSIDEIPEGLINSCESLESFTIPDNVTYIGMGSFAGCKSLKSLIIPENVTTIAYYAFADCNSLTHITIPESVNSIGADAFLRCASLESVFIPSSVHNLGVNSFPQSTIIYCYEYTDADVWATENGYPVIYLDNLNLDDIRTVMLFDDIRIPVGKTVHLPADVFPLSDNPPLIWESNNPSVISVDNGIITANSIGTATVSLSVGNASDSVNVTVYQMANSFQISPSEIWIVAKEGIQLSIVDVEPEGAEYNITWVTSDSSYASVDDGGFVTTKKPGDIIISADGENNIHRECIFHICYPVTSIELESASDEIIPNTDLQLTAFVTMRTQSCENHLVTFSSSNSEIATVDENGLVHAIKPGTVTITVESASGISASKTITVLDVCYVENGEIIDHLWGVVEYNWSEDNTTLTATRTCENNETHIETETVNVTSTILSPTEDTAGSVTYTSAEFSKEGFAVQTKSLEIPALKDLSVINLPSMLTAIENEAFENLACEAIIIPNSCTSVGNYAFRNCKNLKYIKVPANIDIPSTALAGCENVVIDRTAE